MNRNFYFGSALCLSIFFCQARDLNLHNIFHQNNYQKAQKRAAKVYYLIEQWQSMGPDDQERAKGRFSSGVWHYLLNYFFYAKTVVTENKTKVPDLVYLLNLQRNISNSISNLDIQDDKTNAARLILIETDALISDLLAQQ